MFPWWLGRSAKMCAWSRPPIRARSPITSPALCRTNSSGHRSVVPTTPSSDSTTTFSTAPPSAKPRARSSATSRTNPKVRAPAHLPPEARRRRRPLAGLVPDHGVIPLDAHREPEFVGRRHHVARTPFGQRKGSPDPVRHRCPGNLRYAAAGERLAATARTIRRGSEAPDRPPRPPGRPAPARTPRPGGAPRCRSRCRPRPDRCAAPWHRTSVGAAPAPPMTCRRAGRR